MCEGGEISLDLVDLLQLTLQDKQLCSRLLHIRNVCMYVCMKILYGQTHLFLIPSVRHGY